MSSWHTRDMGNGPLPIPLVSIPSALRFGSPPLPAFISNLFLFSTGELMPVHDLTRARNYNGLVKFEDGQVWLSNDQLKTDEPLPGIMTDISVNDNLRFDNTQVDGLSGVQRTFMGYEGAEIRITLDLLSESEEETGKPGGSSCYDKLRKISEHFKRTNKAACPFIYDVYSKQLLARGINRVIFSRLDSWEGDQDDTIRATLTFCEYMPTVVKKEIAVSESKKALGPAKPPAVNPQKTKPAASPAVMKDPSPVVAGFHAGVEGLEYGSKK